MSSSFVVVKILYNFHCYVGLEGGFHLEKQEADAQGIISGMSMYMMPGGVHKPKIVVSPQIQMV